MKTIAATLLLAAALGAGPAQAEPRGDGPPFMQALHGLDLDEAQRAAVRSAIESQREDMRATHERLRAVHEAFDTLDPKAADYRSRVAALLDEAAAAQRARLAQEAELRAAIAAPLSEAQVREWKKALARPPQRRERGERRRPDDEDAGEPRD